MSDFPVIDLLAFEAATGAARTARAAEVDEICRTTGFLAIGNHGVPEFVIKAQWRAVADFFALSPDQKTRVAASYKGYPYGYLGPGAEALAASRGQKTPPDLKESFNGGPLVVPQGEVDPDALAFCYAPTLWPEQPGGFRTAWEAYYRAMEQLAARIMEMFAAALGLDRGFFAPFIDAPISALCALHYPAQSAPAAPGQLRAGAHSDYGRLTILLPQASSRGLQIMTPGGDWADVPPVPGAFIINIGDLMARWTGDRWVSTLHRVVNDGATESRLSLAYFHQPNWHADITGLFGGSHYVPVKSGPYLMDKFRATGM